MPLTLPGNAHLATINYLLSVPEVTTLVGTRISPYVDDTRPCLRVFQVTASDTGSRGWHLGTLLQFDSYADTIGKARQIIDTVYAAMLNLEGTTASGVITGVILERGPDQTADPDRRTSNGERPLQMFSMDMRVYVHP